MKATPYEYIATKMHINESDLSKNISMTSIAMILRRYENIDEYTVSYWNNLIKYFVSESDNPYYFDTIEDFKKFVSGGK